MRWDNFVILQTIDRHQDRFGGAAVWVSTAANQLMDEIVGQQVTDDKLVRGFLQELEILAAEEYLTLRAYD